MLKEKPLQLIESSIDTLCGQSYAFWVGFVGILLAGPEHKHSLKKEEQHEKKHILADAACGGIFCIDAVDC